MDSALEAELAAGDLPPDQLRAVVVRSSSTSLRSKSLVVRDAEKGEVPRVGRFTI